MVNLVATRVLKIEAIVSKVTITVLDQANSALLWSSRKPVLQAKTSLVLAEAPSALRALLLPPWRVSSEAPRSLLQLLWALLVSRVALSVLSAVQLQ